MVRSILSGSTPHQPRGGGGYKYAAKVLETLNLPVLVGRNRGGAVPRSAFVDLPHDGFFLAAVSCC
jgi:hypothetical protein